MAIENPLPIETAVQSYLEYRSDEVTQNTLRSHRYRLEPFVEWCENNGIGDTTEIQKQHFLQYRRHRREEDELNLTSLHTQLTTLRVFIKWCVSYGAITESMATAIDVPQLDRGQQRREQLLEADRAKAIDQYLARYQYGSRDHVLWTILYGVGCRIGGAHGLDVEDFEREEQRLWFRHRPDEDTTLKNGHSGERPVTLSNEITDTLTAYIDDVRVPATDDYGRRPLIAMEGNRPSKSTLRRIVYRWTQPCQIGAECPHNRKETECSTAGYTDSPSECKAIVSPHAIRKRRIIDYRKDEIPDKYISDRCNVSQQIMDKHYDIRSAEEKQTDRAEYFE